ncbi:PKD domain-containing protein [Haloparvum sedimenti]|uniref:PKD domain-containing protein n=1 Tax=Haloparvum sedimenti TaxID=1678448 RepID=UPI00071E8B90|nr:PKD domain-containing protein [Haloparvum sedimenti]
MNKNSERSGRFTALTAAVMAVVVVVSVLAGGAAAATSSVEAGGTQADLGQNGQVTQNVEPTDQENVSLVYVDSSTGNVTVVTGNASGASTHDLNVSATAIGPAADLTEDGTLQVPYMNSNGDLFVVNVTDGNTTQVASSAVQSPSRMAVGTWNGSFGILAANSDDDIVRFHYNSTADTWNETTVKSGADAQAVLGVADYDGDGDDDLVYVNSNPYVAHLSQSGETTTVGSVTIGQGSNVYGAGAPANLDQKGDVRVPVVSSSAEPGVLDSESNLEILDNTDGQKKPVTAANWSGGPEKELVWMTSSGSISYTTLNGTTSSVNADGNQISGVQSAGVAGVYAYEEPSFEVSDFELARTGSQNVTASFDTSTRIDGANVTIETPSGSTEHVTLSGNESSRSSGDELLYEYAIVYDGDADGQYNGTLSNVTPATAADEVTPGLEASTTVDSVAPTVDASGDTTATAGESVSLSANASDATTNVTSIRWELGDGASGNGTEVTHTYDAAGEYTATVTATDAAGNENTDTVTVDVNAADDDSDADESGSTLPADVRERDNAAIDSDDMARLLGSDVQRIEFESAPTDETVVVDRVSDLPEDAPDLDDVVSIYRIDVPAVASGSEATLELSLEESELDGADASAVVVERYDGDEWTALDTSATVEDGEVVIEAETDGFSTFAVTTSGDATDGSDSGDGTSDSTDTADGTPETTEEPTTDDSSDSGDTGDSGSGDSTTGTSETPTASGVNVPGFGTVVALIALVAAAFLARRR